MSLEHAILGFLSRGPFSGYDLKKAFDAAIRHFWPADQSQIYRTLGQLGKRGWAQQEIIHQERRPNRKVYRITEEGRREFRRWMTSFTPPEEIREAALIQVFFAGELQDEEVLTLLERQAGRLRKRLEAYRRLRGRSQETVASVCPPGGVHFWELTLEQGTVMTEANLHWLEGIIRERRTGERVTPRSRAGRVGEAAGAQEEAPTREHASSRGRRDGRKPWKD